MKDGSEQQRIAGHLRWSECSATRLHCRRPGETPGETWRERGCSWRFVANADAAQPPPRAGCGFLGARLLDQETLADRTSALSRTSRARRIVRDERSRKSVLQRNLSRPETARLSGHKTRAHLFLLAWALRRPGAPSSERARPYPADRSCGLPVPSSRCSPPATGDPVPERRGRRLAATLPRFREA